MTWTCPRCERVRESWQLRCPLDGTLQFAPEPSPEPAPPDLVSRPARLQPGEVELRGPLLGQEDTSWQRSPLRPARAAAIIAVAWLAIPLGWAFFQPPSIAPIALLLLGIAALVFLSLSFFVWRFVPNGSTPIAAFVNLIEPLGFWIVDAFPIMNRQPVYTVRMPGPPGGEPVRVRAVGATPWPPPAGLEMRVVGRWIAEPSVLAARLLEIPGFADPDRVEGTVKVDAPHGWPWAVAILAPAAVLLIAWISAVRG